jgi:hypothetical protein
MNTTFIESFVNGWRFIRGGVCVWVWVWGVGVHFVGVVTRLAKNTDWGGGAVISLNKLFLKLKKLGNFRSFWI